MGPHVGIGPGGEPGVVAREGREAPSSACGALLALLGDLEAGLSGVVPDPDDLEQGLIRERIGTKLAGGPTPHLFELTRVTHDTIGGDLERLLALLDR